MSAYETVDLTDMSLKELATLGIEMKDDLMFWLIVGFLAGRIEVQQYFEYFKYRTALLKAGRAHDRVKGVSLLEKLIADVKRNTNPLLRTEDGL